MDKITLNKKKTITLKRTSTQRSDSSGSESSSPSDKRVRNTKYKITRKKLLSADENRCRS